MKFSNRFALRLKTLRHSRMLLLSILGCLLLGLLGQGISWANAARWAINYQPPQEVAWANPTNYGPRFRQDIYGVPATNAPIVVLHETVSSADSAINFFQTPHPNDADQASYHALIRLNGTIVYTVPFEYRAFGAGNSVFTSERGPEAVQTNPKYPGSVNNFAYHFSFETPVDGRHNGNSHSGYTLNQYRSLAWLVAYTKVPNTRITFHKWVDRSGSRKDPRSFNHRLFLTALQQYRQAADRNSPVPIIAQVRSPSDEYEEVKSSLDAFS
jgi:hypothetical protein